MLANTRHKDGKRHVHIVPVKLCRPQNNKKNTYWCSFCNGISGLAELFSDEHVLFMSQDDKARVPIGLSACKKQDVILIYLEYKVSLPDHDFPTGKQHKLIPSVYASCKRQKNNPAISYIGPTNIAIWSSKHDKSCAVSNHEDFQKLLRY